MLCPEDSRFLPLAEKVTVHVVVRSNNLDLLFRDACRLTKRRVVSQSIIAPVGMARFDDYHLLQLGCKAAPTAFPLHHSGEGRQHHLHKWSMSGDAM